MKPRIIIYLICILLGAWLGLGSIIHLMIGYVLLVYICGLWLLGTLIYAVSKTRHGWRSLKPAIWVICWALAIVTSYFVGGLFGKHEVSLAKAFPFAIRPLIEKHQAVYGELPERLDQIVGMPSIPRLLESSKQEGHFTFWINDPATLYDGWQFDHNSNTWFHDD